MTHTAKIRAKGLDGTGVTEDIAKGMSNRLGGTTLAIVELEHVAHLTDSKGDHQAQLTIGLIEPILGDRTEDVTRELMRALYRDRRAREGDALPGVDDGPSVDDAVTAVQAHIERDEDGAPAGTWDGSTDQDARAEFDEDLKRPLPGFDGAPGDEPPARPDPEFTDAEVSHRFMAGTNDATRCAVEGCGKTSRAKVHKPLGEG